jgi:hypothetical protein
MDDIREKVLEILMLKYFNNGGIKVLITDKDYMHFSDNVAKVTNQNPAFNINTWKRVFCRLKKDDGSPYPLTSRTKQAIAQYLGFEDWEELKENLDEEYERILRKGGRNCTSTIQPANPIDLMLKNLRKGDIIEILYYPERRLLLEFIKKDTYKVVSSTNSHIEQGDIIYTSSLYNDLPLICEIIRNGISKGTYRSAHGHNIQSIKRIKQEISI